MSPAYLTHHFLIRRRSQSSNVFFPRVAHYGPPESVPGDELTRQDRAAPGGATNSQDKGAAGGLLDAQSAAATLPPTKPPGSVLSHRRRLSYGSLARRPSSQGRRDSTTSPTPPSQSFRPHHQRRRSTSPPPPPASERPPSRSEADPEAALQARLRKAKRMKPRGKPREKPLIPDDREDSFRVENVDVWYVSRTAQPKWKNEGNDAFRKLAVDRRCLQADPGLTPAPRSRSPYSEHQTSGMHNCAIYGCSGAGCHAGSPPVIEPRVEELLEIAGRNLERHEKELEMPSKRKSQSTLKRTTNAPRRTTGSASRVGSTPLRTSTSVLHMEE